MNLEERIKYLRAKGLSKKLSARWHKKWWGVLLLAILASLLLVSLSFIFLIIHLISNPVEMALVRKSLKSSDEVKSVYSDYNPANIKIVEGTNSYFLGAENPVLTIVVFSDFSCPICKESLPIISSLAIKYGEQVKIIVRDFPVISEESENLALVARCAGEQDKYWPMFYKLFDWQDELYNLGIGALVEEVGIVETDEFYNCIDEKKYISNIAKDKSDGVFLQIAGTPTWFINGVKVGEGAIPFSFWSEFLDKALKNKE